MSAEQHLRDGNLSAALKELQDLVRKEPAKAKHRVFLFQIYVILGQWERAKTQLKVVRDLDGTTIPMVKTYEQALRCEVLRAEVWQGARSPLVFGEPANWIAAMIQAVALSAKGLVDQAQALRAQALDQAPALPGRVQLAVKGEDKAATTEQAFAWLADADSRLGPLLEVIMNGKYYWVPWSAISTVTLEAPADLRDMVWMPAQFRWRNGGEAVGLWPSRYPGTETATDAALQLCRRTEWSDAGSDEFRGAGQRLLATDAGEYALLDVRKITLDAPA
ncbi:MAG TPA: type VI secretion system accessory protein TagJ [Planctomycetota bacterium]